jgi:hypothetical protein
VVWLGALRLGLRLGHEAALLGLAVLLGAAAVVHFTGCIDPNLTGPPWARSGTLAGCRCGLGRRGGRAGRGRSRRTP